MRPASLPAVIALLALVVLAGCGAFGAAGSDREPTRTLTPAAVPTVEPTPTPTAEPGEDGSAPVLLENAVGRDQVVVLSVVEGPVSTVEVFYRDGGTAVVDYAADPSSLDVRLAEGGVVGVRAPNGTATSEYRVAANTSVAQRPFPALGRAGAGTSVLWAVVPVAQSGVPTSVAAAGVESCSPPHSLVTEFRVRVLIRGDGVTVDCA